jgi:hypothetical protein
MTRISRIQRNVLFEEEPSGTGKDENGENSLLRRTYEVKDAPW